MVQVEVVRRLVKHQHLRLLGQGACQLHPLAFPT
ncbi:Protein of unknown function [Propionibacterium freudenreichii]|nr:Protein of unknown function [Propionibacterium freudenreichii]